MMKHAKLAAALMSLSLVAGAGTAQAGPIERACMKSDRRAATVSLCRCIQRAADATLRGGDQRRAAKFFRDPDEAQQVRMSKRDADDAFWDRYVAFGAAAGANCGG